MIVVAGCCRMACWAGEEAGRYLIDVGFVLEYCDHVQMIQPLTLLFLGDS